MAISISSFPRCMIGYFSFTFYNMWLESYDYTNHSVILNHEQIELNEYGHFEIHIAENNNGNANWLDTAGHTSGYLVARSLLLEGTHPDLDVKVVKFLKLNTN